MMSTVLVHTVDGVCFQKQNGRLAMLDAAGFLAQEAVHGKGIIEHLQSM